MLSFHEQQLVYNNLKDFKDVFLIELPFSLPPKQIIEHKIDLILGFALVIIPLCRLIRLEEYEVTKQLKHYLSIGHIRHNKSPWGLFLILVKMKDGIW